METGSQINHDFIRGLTVAAGYDGSLDHIKLILMQRRELARFILENGLSEQSKQAYDYINSQILLALGIAAQPSVQADGACAHTKFFDDGGVFTCANCHADITPRR